MQQQSRPPVIAVDPGRGKCGVAVVAPDGAVLERAITDADRIGDVVAELLERHAAATVILGGRTGSENARRRIAQATGREIAPVDEHMSTLQARRRYWRERPPRGLMRLVPEGLRVPPEPIDDWAAVILAERYLGLAER